MSDKELVDKIVMFRTELERQKAGMGIISLFDTICSYYGEQHRTIESQKEEIKLWKNAYDEGDPVLKDEIERLKEEIEKQRSRSTEFLNSKIDTANAKHMLDTKNKQLQTENEFLKAITELAVKGLEQFANRGSWTEVQHIESLKDYAVWTGDTNEPWIDAKSTLSEIERLSHEHNS